MAKQAVSPGVARVFKATRGSLGRVIRGAEITEPEAVAERQAERDIVVCDGTPRDNRNLARQIESAVGSCQRQEPHDRAGPYALPHYQQQIPPPEGHAFYETANRKAAKGP